MKAHDSCQDSTTSHRGHSMLVNKRMARSPGKISKRRHIDFGVESEENVPPTQHNQVLQEILGQIREECRTLCQPGFESSFRRTDLNSFMEQEEELKNHAPMLYQVLRASAVNPSTEKKKSSTTSDTSSGIVTAAGILLYSRNEFMNAHQTMTGLILKRNAAGKVAFNRLHARSLSVSYRTVLRKQMEYDNDHDKLVCQWKEDMESDMAQHEEIPETLSIRQKHVEHPHPGFKLIGDNVDLQIEPRVSIISEGNKDLHYYNVMAVTHRVPANDLNNEHPEGAVESVPWSAYLPTAEDNKSQKAEWNYLIGKTIATHIPHFEWFKSHIPDHLEHHYSNLTKERTEVVNLGIILENENTNEGMANIMTETHKYVSVVDGITEKVLSGGDLLTCERQLNAQEYRADSDEPVKRWGGLVPTIEDFHTFVNFCEVIWGSLYSTLSSGDTGTLYSARNFLGAYNVTTDPFKNVNGCTDLLEKFTIMLTITAALEFFGMESIQSEPSKHIFDPTTTVPKVYISDTLNALLEEYAIHDGPDMQVPVKLTCSDCSKEYKTLKGLQNHRKTKHQVYDSNTPGYTSDHDGILNYGCYALSLCLMAHNFTDARKHGDGARIIKLHKFILLYFKMAGKSKYAYHCLHVLMQVNCLLTPKLSHQLTWNSFVNNSGGIGNNIEMDREMEYQNRAFKEECRGFRGKIIDASVLRVGRAARHVDVVMEAYDSSYQIRSASGKHKKKDSKKDLIDLIQHVHKEHIFLHVPGRTYFAFPTISRNPLQTMDLAKLQMWMKKTTRDLSRKRIYHT